MPRCYTGGTTERRFGVTNPSRRIDWEAMGDETLQPIRRPFNATVTPPGSKSLTNRALVLAALARGESVVRNVLIAEDTEVMLESLRRLGFELGTEEDGRTIHVRGGGGTVPAARAELHCGNSGTTIRFLTALCSAGRGEYFLDGIERMRQRPIGQLVDLLRNLGGRVEYAATSGTPPLRVDARGLAGGIARFPAAQSSQYLSAVLHVAPLARHEVSIDLDPGQTSWPYVAMTMQLIDRFGVMCELTRDPKTGEPRQVNVPREPLVGCAYEVEPDASSASYFLAAAAINEGSRVTIEGLGKSSLQGDVGIAEVLRKMGAYVKSTDRSVTVEGTGQLENIDVDLSAMPDMAQTLAVVCCFADGASVIRGLHTLRHKETDRLAALEAELGKLGAGVSVNGDSLSIEPPDTLRNATIETYNDHRMAMSFAVAGTRVNGLTIRGAECVSKTYPGFFEDFRRVVDSS